MFATFSKLPSGLWGVKIVFDKTGESVMAGDRIEVMKRNGKTATVTVESVGQVENREVIVKITEKTPARQGRKGFRRSYVATTFRGRCEDAPSVYYGCGHEDYPCCGC